MSDLPLSVVVMCFVAALMECHPTSHEHIKEDDNVYACTESGIVRGRKLNVDVDSDVHLFLGIPYAAPPVGELRFSKPTPARSWKGVRDATQHGAKCVQRLIPGDPVLENVPFSEDCLSLDIYLSRAKNQSLWESDMAVMMFIHGGSFYGGSGAKYNFTNLAMKGVMVVSINYRLGVLGFLSTEDDVIPGNFGLLDMVMALDWVKKNIRSFGGDPDRITLFGGSSGAVSVSLLTLSPLSRGKFKGAIMQSGESTAVWAFHSPNSKMVKPLDISKALNESLGCRTSSDGFSKSLLECLRQRSVDEIMAAEKDIKPYLEQFLIYLWRPVVETTFGFLPDLPINLHQDPSSVAIPTIHGYTKHDGSFVVSDPENDGLSSEELRAMFSRYAKFFFPLNAEAFLKGVENFYFPKSVAETASSLDRRKIAIEFTTDLCFAVPAIREAISFSDNCKRVNSYVYELALRPSYITSASWMGVEHASEKGLVLDLPRGPDPFMFPDYTDVDSNAADLVSTMWANFAKYGNPTVEPVDGIVWKPFVSAAPPMQCAQCDSSAPGGSVFGTQLQYNFLRIGKTSKMVPFDQCEKINLWSRFS